MNVELIQQEYQAEKEDQAKETKDKQTKNRSIDARDKERVKESLKHFYGCKEEQKRARQTRTQ